MSILYSVHGSHLFGWLKTMKLFLRRLIMLLPDLSLSGIFLCHQMSNIFRYSSFIYLQALKRFFVWRKKRLKNFYSKHQQRICGMGWSRRVIIKFKIFMFRSFEGASYYSYDLQRKNEKQYCLTKVEFPIANHDDLFCIAKEPNWRIPSKETAKATPIPIRTYLQRTKHEIPTIDSKINTLISLAQFEEVYCSLDGIKDQDFRIRK